MDHAEEKEVMDLALQAGHLLLENGAEIFRVEETMERICSHYGVESANEFVLSNGIFVTAGNEREKVFAKVEHIPVSGTHLDKVTAINQLSREIAEGRYTVEEAMEELQRIRRAPGKKKAHADSGFRCRQCCFLLSLRRQCGRYAGGAPGGTSALYVCAVFQ
jgi:uncharacterized membrane protein YjjP (DUF1212 family)